MGRRNLVNEHGFHLPVSASRNAMYWHLIVLHICIVCDVGEPLYVVFGPIVLCLLWKTVTFVYFVCGRRFPIFETFPCLITTTVHFAVTASDSLQHCLAG